MVHVHVAPVACKMAAGAGTVTIKRSCHMVVLHAVSTSASPMLVATQLPGMHVCHSSIVRLASMQARLLKKARGLEGEPLKLKVSGLTRKLYEEKDRAAAAAAMARERERCSLSISCVQQTYSQHACSCLVCAGNRTSVRNKPEAAFRLLNG